MFDSNTRLYDKTIRQSYIQHMLELVDYGYAGFELHIDRSSEVATAYPSCSDEIEAYAEFRHEIDQAGLSHVALATNVGSSAALDPSSNDADRRAAGLEFLQSRIDITAALRGKIMMGPVLVPYGAFVHSAPNGEDVWSDALQEELTQRYDNAAPVLNQLGDYAQSRDVKVAIEPITHWETPGPNKLAQLTAFLKKVASRNIGAIIDSAHETLDGDGPDKFIAQVSQLADDGRLHYAQASPPDRGSLEHSWLPWGPIFRPLLSHYQGPVAIEIFNALPGFTQGLRLSRRKYWIPGIDPASSWPSAYEVAKASLHKLRLEFDRILA